LPTFRLSINDRPERFEYLPRGARCVVSYQNDMQGIIFSRSYMAGLRANRLVPSITNQTFYSSSACHPATFHLKNTVLGCRFQVWIIFCTLLLWNCRVLT
jgi:hypothetical protein